MYCHQVFPRPKGSHLTVLFPPSPLYSIFCCLSHLTSQYDCSKPSHLQPPLFCFSSLNLVFLYKSLSLGSWSFFFPSAFKLGFSMLHTAGFVLMPKNTTASTYREMWSLAMWGHQQHQLTSSVWWGIYALLEITSHLHSHVPAPNQDKTRTPTTFHPPLPSPQPPFHGTETWHGDQRAARLPVWTIERREAEASHSDHLHHSSEVAMEKRGH